MKIKKKTLQTGRTENPGTPPVLADQNGSVIVMVLLMLTIMSVIGIVSSNSHVTENFIVRNLAIRKQNVFLLDSALMRGYQEFMQISDADALNFNPNAGPNAAWINDINNDPPGVGSPEEFINTIWYEDTFSQRCLGPANSRAENTVQLLTARGENLNGGLRYAIVGWGPVNLGTGGGSTSVSIKPNKTNWHGGRLMAEYISVDGGGNANGFGILRQEMGLRRQW
jgi:hypothetical protein